ncbi:Ankyrin repeat protein 2 [Giardia muris]|uniref:Ankyrin repeat protein 2 n=1 Tax=Giardia muris TaxID=5742 RepID=A0A4Z1T7B0_GIAMU|nr:Ankyrin repeat protein 2 [Giardia muris]|eukprot:TNJ28381.1 Ankyrin repeat protein 2 [Giardia muris]
MSPWNHLSPSTGSIRDIIMGSLVIVENALQDEVEDGDDLQSMSISTLFGAILLHNLQGVETRLEDMHITDLFGHTALMLAAELGYADLIPPLQQLQGLQDIFGNTALMYATENGYRECLPLLQSELGLQNIIGDTALLCAIRKGHAHCIPDLVGEIRTKDECYQLIELAFELHQIECVIALLDGLTDLADSVHQLLRAALTNDTSALKVILPTVQDKKKYCTFALTLAAAHGNTEAVQFLLPKAQGRVRNGSYAIMYAAHEGHLGCIQALVAKQGRRRTTSDDTALSIAASQGHYPCVQFLLKSRLDRKLLQHALAQAISALHPECAEAILQKAPKAKYSYKVLVKAARNGFTNCVSLLMRSTKLRPNESRTALMAAAQYGHLDCVIQLLEREVSLQDSEGRTALVFAAYTGHRACVDKLLDERGLTTHTGRTALMYAAVADRMGCLEPLLTEAGFQDEDGRTALMLAAQDGNYGCITILRRFEARMQRKDGTTALMLAAENGFHACVRLLTSEQCLQDSTGQTALMRAARRGHANCLPELMHEKRVQDMEGQTALMHAVKHGHVECVRQLATQECGLRSDAGLTALSLACKIGNVQMLPYLISELGISMDNEHQSPYFYAMSHSGGEVIEALIELTLPSLLRNSSYAACVYSSLIERLERFFFEMVEEGDDRDRLRMAFDLAASLITDGSELLGEDQTMRASRAIDLFNELLVELSDEGVDPLACQCIICMDARPSVVFTPCLHMVMCAHCLGYLDGTCPYCRKGIREMVHTNEISDSDRPLSVSSWSPSVEGSVGSCNTLVTASSTADSVSLR